MSLVTLRQALDEADHGTYALGAFNCSDLAQAVAVLDAARATDSPVILQVLAQVSAYGDHTLWWPSLAALIDQYPDVTVVWHLDHGPDLQTCAKAVEAGFTSVMIDGSVTADGVTPNRFEANVEITREVVELAHREGVSVEGELGTIGGSDGDDVAGKPIVLADPDEARDFVQATGVDALAVAIGTSHGTYKFDREPDAEVLRMDLIEAIHALVPKVHLVMHGSSSLPHELVAEINAAGGDLPRSWGVPLAEKERSAAAGIRKINQGVDSQLAFLAGTLAELSADPKAVDPGGWIAAGRTRMQQMLEARMVAFGSAGHGGDYQPVSLQEMSARYATSDHGPSTTQQEMTSR